MECRLAVDQADLSGGDLAAIESDFAAPEAANECQHRAATECTQRADERVDTRGLRERAHQVLAIVRHVAQDPPDRDNIAQVDRVREHRIRPRGDQLGARAVAREYDRDIRLGGDQELAGTLDQVDRGTLAAADQRERWRIAIRESELEGCEVLGDRRNDRFDAFALEAKLDLTARPGIGVEHDDFRRSRCRHARRCSINRWRGLAA